LTEFSLSVKFCPVSGAQPEKRTNPKKGGSDGCKETGQEKDLGQKDCKEDS